MSLPKQFAVSLGLVSGIILIAYFSTGLIGYRIVALVLLLAVSVIAMLFDLRPVLTTAVISALSWNFFFIPPVFTFHIGTPEDALMFLMYFIIALINAVLSVKINQLRKKARDKEERGKTLHLYNTMLNSLSHELRTPIAAIIGSVDTIRENGERLSVANREELYREIETAAFRLNRQVENLLSMSRIESGVLQLRPDWCDVNELVNKVIRMNEHDVQHNRIEFIPDETLPLLQLERTLLEQILYNLVHNAIQHTPENTVIKLTAAYRDGFCIITVCDNGPGFPDEYIHAVFEKFYRLPNSATGGTGLGLSIAKGFTEVLGGTLRLSNLPEGGACFTVTLPAEHSYNF